MAKATILYNISIPIDIPNTDKAQWTNVGVIVQTANGKIFGKINFLPVDGWKGNFACFNAPAPGSAKKDTGAGEYQEPLDQEPELP
jgi:hypothetical protein